MWYRQNPNQRKLLWQKRKQLRKPLKRLPKQEEKRNSELSLGVPHRKMDTPGEFNLRLTCLEPLDIRNRHVQ